MAYTTIDDPTAYFKIQLYTGDGVAIGSGGKAIVFDDTDTDMQPDLVWIKERDSTSKHQVIDSARGVTKHIDIGDETTAESTQSEGLTTFGSDGFTVGENGAVNQDSQTYVAWCWKESATAGFDIVLYTGTGSTATPSHSLSAVPHLMLVQRRNQAEGCQVYHHKNTSEPETDALELNTVAATADAANRFNDTAPTSSVFTVESHSTTNEADDTYVAYLFSEKQGYSKFGSYTGNNDNGDGPFIFCGFRPAFLICKKTGGTADWIIVDSKRDTGNVTENYLHVDTDVETTYSTNRVDLLSNGFKLRGNSEQFNIATTYVYIAFAEAPLVNSNGVPCNAR